MAEKNRGKQFEQVIRQSFEKVQGVSIDRIPDQVTRYRGSSSNICDFVVYKYPYLYYLECKTIHGATFPFSNVRDNQWNGLLGKSNIDGVKAGLLVWWVDYDVTRYIPIDVLDPIKVSGRKSIRYDDTDYLYKEIHGEKKRVLFDYDMSDFFY